MPKKIKHEMPPVGTRLKGRTKGNDVYAEIVSREKDTVGILFNGVVYNSMSAAARAATGARGWSIDGWLFWKIVGSE